MKKENRVLQFLTSKKARSYLLIAVLVVALYVVFNLLIGAGVINRYYEGIVRLICINIIMAVSLNLVCGFMGQLALGHAGFMSVGAYAAALFTMNSGLPEAVALPLSLIVGGLFAAVIGFIIGIPALRMRGDYLAIITLGFGEIIRVILTNIDYRRRDGTERNSCLHQFHQCLLGDDHFCLCHLCLYQVPSWPCGSLDSRGRDRGGSFRRSHYLL